MPEPDHNLSQYVKDWNTYQMLHVMYYHQLDHGALHLQN